MGGEHAGGIEHLGFLLGRTGAEQDVAGLLAAFDGAHGDAMAHGEHGFKQGAVGVFADAAHFACAGHIYAEHGVGFLQAVEGELGGLDADVVEVEEVLGGFLYGEAEHHLRGEVDEVELQDF